MKSKLLAVCLLLIAPFVQAHKSSDSYINLKVDNNKITVRWDIALRDLEYALTLDQNEDGAITWSELRSHYQTIADYTFKHLQINPDNNECQRNEGPLQVDHNSDGAYAILNFKLNCQSPIDHLNINYQFLFDLDPTHRGLLQISNGQQDQFIIFSPENFQSRVDFQQSGHWLTFSQFVGEGIWHIWIGYDHILFLLCLLLPSVVRKTKSGWRSNPSFINTLLQVGKVVTAFTVAHSLTLGLAVFDWVHLPSRWVESAIALSVILAAINNLYPFFSERVWLVAFAFGLIHGFGFASVLGDLDLTLANQGVSLFGFNLGVEIGQLAIVLLFLPGAFFLAKFRFYQRIVLPTGSHAIILLATLWFLQRAFDLKINTI